MFRRSIIVSLAAVLVVGPAAAREPEAPKVISWSNSKTSDQKTCLLVKPGEKITFTIKADGAEKYLWEVNKAAQKGTDGSSLKWTVPDKKGLWKIQAKATNKSLDQYVAGLVEDFRKFPWMRWNKRYGKKWIRDTSRKEVPATIKDGYYPPQCRKEWIVSTFLKEVKPAESIQKAIDAIPAEGGIVELLPGKHDVRKTVRINRSNVAILGTHDSEIRSHLDSSKHIFQVNENWIGDGTGDPRKLPNLKNVTFRGFKVVTDYKRKGYGCVVKTDKVDDLTLEGLDVSSKEFGVGVVTVNFGRFRNSNYYGTSKDTRIFNNTIRNSGRMSGVCSNNSVVAYNRITGKRRGSRDYTMYFEAANNNISIHHNYLKDVGIIQTESYGAHIFNNVCIGGYMGITARYNPWNSRIEGNVITGATYAGIHVFSQSGLKNVWIRNNRIFNCPGSGIEFGEPQWGSTTKGTCYIFIVNNTIYNNGGDGIRNSNRVDTPWTVKMSNNIIADNAGYGISLVHKNITETHNYNNVWNNKKGSYNQSKAGAGDISADPLFANPSKGDFHLKSKTGRWDPKAKKWVKDNVTSPCIDAGDPKADFSREPLPNGRRTNMGAYGNTTEASMSLMKQKGNNAK